EAIMQFLDGGADEEKWPPGTDYIIAFTNETQRIERENHKYRELLEAALKSARKVIEHYADEINTWDYYGDSLTVYRHGNLTGTGGPDIARKWLEENQEGE